MQFPLRDKKTCISEEPQFPWVVREEGYLTYTEVEQYLSSNIEIATLRSKPRHLIPLNGIDRALVIASLNDLTILPAEHIVKLGQLPRYASASTFLVKINNDSGTLLVHEHHCCIQLFPTVAVNCSEQL
jgi:hypothetical protein